MPPGRPPTFKSPEVLQGEIKNYFAAIADQKMKLTISGLCYALGFDSRQSFYDYEKKPDFTYTIKRARLFIESHYEQLIQGNNPTGAIFALKNFGWSDKQEIEQSGNMNLDITFKDAE